MSWRDCVTLEQRWSRLPNTKTGVHCIAYDYFSSLSFMQHVAELCCTLRVPWLALIRVFLPPRVLMVSSHITFGSPQRSFHFTFRLVASSHSLWTKSTWRESHFLFHFALDSLCDKTETNCFRLTLCLATLPLVEVCFIRAPHCLLVYDASQLESFPQCAPGFEA